MEEVTVWVFNGPKRFPGFPSAVFLSREYGEAWIQRNSATGTLTRYPVNIGVYEWAVANGFFKPKKAEHSQPTFIESFSSAHQDHLHYKQGQVSAGVDQGIAEETRGRGARDATVEEVTVWVFNGPKRFPGFPSAVFLSREYGEAWIQRNSATGTLTRYPVNIGVYEWAVANGFFKPKKAEHSQPTFIESFSSTRQEHYHYLEGQLSAG